MQRNDPVLDTLFMPLLNGLLDWPRQGALFLRARMGPVLLQRSWPGLSCEQTYKPEFDALQRSSQTVRASNDNARPNLHSLVLVLPPRQRDEARALFARALDEKDADGIVMACVANDAGAKSAETDLARLAGTVTTLSKHKCRVFWTKPGAPVDVALAAQWRDLDAARAIEKGRFQSRPGVFAWDRIDPASALLAMHLPADLQGRAADLGAGYGYLSDELLQRCPGIRTLDVFEAESRALDLARENLAGVATQAGIEYHWHDVTDGLPHAYDVIVTNPPFHAAGSGDRPDIGRRFIAAAADALNPGGRLWLVANRHLPYETVLNARFGSARIVAQQSGFKVIEAVKAIQAAPSHKRSR